jgi:hypothetical protein
MTDIEINRLLGSHKLTILKTKIRISQKSLFKYIEYDVPLEIIVHSKIVKVEINRDLIFWGLIVFIIGIVFNMLDALLFFTILSCISLTLIITGLFTRKRTIIINTLSETPIILQYRKSNQKATSDFADTILDKSKEYLINKYSKIDKDLPIENQINNLEFLWSRDLIDDLKYEELKNIILNKKARSKTIGFE